MAAARQSAASSRKLSVENLTALGAERLAELLLAQAEQDKLFARTLRMAIAGKDDPAALAAEIEKRLKTILRSRSFIEWNATATLARELDQLRQSIAGSLTAAAPALADRCMRRLLALARPVFERADDSSGRLGAVFREAGADLGTILGAAGVSDREMLAAEILSLIEADGFGVFDELPEAVSPALGREGRAALRRMILERRSRAEDQDRRALDYRTGWLLPKLADLDDDVDAFIATVDPDRRNALLNAQVAKRLIDHRRFEEALGWTNAPTERGSNDHERESLRLAALEGLQRKEDAQRQRRLLFERFLDPDMLRAWLKRLPDFEDFDAEQAALELVANSADATRALAFLIAWPDLGRAERLVQDRLDEIEGRDYSILRPAAEALSGTSPVAATLLYQRLVESVLERGNSKLYPYAARDWHAAAHLARRLRDQSCPPHDVWIASIRAAHGRKVGFWSTLQVGR